MTLYDFFQNFAGPLATICAASGAWYFARAQVKVAQEQRVIAAEKLRLELFDKRYEIYVSVRDLIMVVISSGNANYGDSRVVKALEKNREAVFLFGDDVVDFVCKISEHVDFICKSNEILFGLFDEELDRNGALNSKTIAVGNLESALSRLTTIFARELGFRP
ncbi:hypothetical protein M2323_002686 [Rhodoblastus acidophilus]|uniref:hypothetical protein n=1 Tax=Rhodoblastus acidophilus TaxID=1074 RepID=UPI002224A368|nr:hypothetical protein [Rhodoblastus acidophilus]MCW2284799.1 hypothetical protein [Rhodoblastus acidophilus]MCW2333752.1 hypothetical protein [Rhodoblastus acidophilus]